MSTTQPAPVPVVPTNEVFQFVRKSSDWLAPSEIRTLLKKNLGYTSRQVTVSARHSRQYVTVTVRDASVDLARVESFRKSLDTWSMAQDDVVSGQSIEVRTTSEVDAIHAAPFVDEAAKIAFELTQPGQWKNATNGANVHFQGFDFVVSRTGFDRHFGGSRDGAISKSSHQLALAIARA